MKRIFAVAVTGVTLLASQSVAGADAVTFLDVTLGEPLRLPKCSGPGPQNTECWNELDDLIRREDNVREIWLSPTQVLDFPFLRPNFRVFLLDGRVEGIAVSTSGIDDQEKVLNALTEKFGKPEKMELQKGGVGEGGTLSVIHAFWTLNEVEVQFWGTYQALLERGYIQFITPAYANYLGKPNNK